jgi:hypothetical protein
MSHRRVRISETVALPVEFYAKKDHVVGVMWIGESSIGLRFNSPEHILEFMTKLMDKAVKVWPDNELIREYLSDE